MAADATDDEPAAMADVKAAMAWAGFDVTSMAEDSVAGSLLKHLGVTPTTLPRVIGIFSEDDLAATQYTWKIPDATGERAPSLGEQGMTKLFFRACQLVAGTGQTLQELKTKTQAPPVQPQPNTIKYHSSAIDVTCQESEAQLCDLPDR